MVTKQALRTKGLVELALFLAIICILAFTPLGYIPLGAITPTTIHIPVIIAGIVLGPKKGAITGFMFGLTSFLKSSFFAPTVTSFLFSPFYPGGNALSLVICFVPRILLGVFAYYIYVGMCRVVKNKSLSCTVSAILSTLIHTVLVLGMAYLFFGREYAEATGKSFDVLLYALLGIVGTNSVPEAIVAGIICTAVCAAIFKLKRNA